MNKIFPRLAAALLFLSFTATAEISSAESSDVDLSGATITTESLEALARGVGLSLQRTAPAGSRKIKIAILDSGFLGFKEALGNTIPSSTKLRAGPTLFDPKKEGGHGLKMAEIVTNLIGRTTTNFDLHLFRSNGYTNLQNAIKTAIAEKFDVVLYATVWEYGGNGDGRGFINKLVSTATANGIAWINATGNFGRKTYVAAVERSADDWARLPGPANSVQVHCHQNKSGLCHLRVVLSWNSFSDDIATGTDKDLDLVVTDDAGKIQANQDMPVSGGVQKKVVAQGETGVSLYPREIFQADVKSGVYYLKAKIRSLNFTPVDELRFSVSGDFLELLNRTEGESLNNPADNPSVITAGATDAADSSVSRKLNRPDVSTVSLIKTEDGAEFKGSSQAAAAYTARVAYELSKLDSFDRDAMLIILRGGTPRPKAEAPSKAPGNQSGSSKTNLGQTGPGCYVFHALVLTGSHVQKILREGGFVVDTASGPKIFVSENPFQLAARLGIAVDMQRVDAASELILIADRQGLYAMPLANRARLANQTVEIVTKPQGATYCPIR